MTEPVKIDFNETKILVPETVLDWGKTLIVAPHPDDESLGCGGALALLRKYDREVLVLTVSDGTLSHPNSVKYPPEKLRELRESEMLAACAVLGIAEDKVSFLRFPDRRVPDETAVDFEAAAQKVEKYLIEHQPQTILVPWRRDPHPDHRASWQIFNRINRKFNRRFRLLEYPIWLWEMAENRDLPMEENVAAVRLDIADALKQKQQAVRAHVSQTTDLIDDDPEGFRLSPEMLAHFAVPFEVYLEEIR